MLRRTRHDVRQGSSSATEKWRPPEGVGGTYPIEREEYLPGDSEGHRDEGNHDPIDDIASCPEVSRQSAPKQEYREPKRYHRAFNGNVKMPFLKPINFLMPPTASPSSETSTAIPEISVDQSHRRKGER